MIEIKHGNEKLQIRKNSKGAFFCIFGAEEGGKSNLYEMNLTALDIQNLLAFLQTGATEDK